MSVPLPRGRAPLPLFIGFALFLLVLGYLITASFARRETRVFIPSPLERTRATGWMRASDTITIDATDGARWRFVSLSDGRVLAPSDSAGWELAVKRYHVTVSGALADLGAVPFADARVSPVARFVASAPGEEANTAIARWYRYGGLTHLLEPNGHVYALRARDGRMWKLEVLGYYCPRLTAGCLTLRYAPLR